MTRAQPEADAVDRRRSTASARRRAPMNLEDVLKGETLEERIYRHRCVEALVDGDSVGRLSARRTSSSAASRRRRRSSSSSRRSYDPKQMPGRAQSGAALAVRRRAADGRGDAPADDSRGRPLRRGAAEPGRRAAAPGRAVEVRLQGASSRSSRSGSSRSSRSTPGRNRRRTSTASTRT